MEVFGKDETYDPRSDALVRVEARRLRDKLRRYYETEGTANPVRIELPTGSYVPVFRAWRPVSAATRAWRRARPLAGPAALVLIAAALYWSSRPPPPQAAPLSSIAVLPFTNLNQDPGGDYFSAGLVEDLNTMLGRLTGLRVVARTSTVQFQQRPVDVRAIGQQLRVGAIVEGTTRGTRWRTPRSPTRTRRWAFTRWRRGPRRSPAPPRP